VEKVIWPSATSSSTMCCLLQQISCNALVP
jgi:hypothetical protein